MRVKEREFCASVYGCWVVGSEHVHRGRSGQIWSFTPPLIINPDPFRIPQTIWRSLLEIGRPKDVPLVSEVTLASSDYAT